MTNLGCPDNGHDNGRDNGGARIIEVRIREVPLYTSVVLVKVLVIVVNKKVLVIYMVFNVIRTW